MRSCPEACSAIQNSASQKPASHSPAAQSKDEFQFVRFVCFSESGQAELLRLCDGDNLTVQGALKCELYRPEGGEPKLSLSIVADQVLALVPPPRQPKPKQMKTHARAKSAALARGRQAPGHPMTFHFNGKIP